MPKRGNRLTADGADRAEPIVTYTRLSPEAAASGEDGRIEPHFTAVRVDGRGRPVGARHDEAVDDLPFVDAPPSDVSLDPVAAVSAGETRHPRRRRGPRIAALAGVLAFVGGAGVLAFTYGGIVTGDAGAPPPHAGVAADSALLAALDGTVDTSGRSVRVVSADQIPTFPSETAALAPRAAADPVAGGAALSDQATVSGEAALSAEPPDRVILNPPAPRLRPATASFNPPQPVSADGGAAVAQATAGTAGAAPDVDTALANVDRILSEQHAASAVVGSGDEDYYGTLAPIDVAPQPLAYPPPAPLSGVGDAYPPNPAYIGGTAASGGEPYGPYYPGQDPYAQGQGYPAASLQLPPGVNLAAEQAPASPWWLPKRRVLIIPNAPVPPEAIPQGQGGFDGFQ